MNTQSFQLRNLGALASLFFLGLTLSMSSCDVDESSSTPTDADDDATDTVAPPTDSSTGATVPDPIDGFSLVVTQNDNYSILVSKDGDGSTACTAEEGERINCVVDMNELDLYLNGLKLGWAAPQDECDYLGEYHYFYAAYPVGFMPSRVFYNADSEGVLQDIESYNPAGGSIQTPWNAMEAGSNCGTDIVYLIDGTYYCHADLFGFAAAETDSLRCPWDYSEFDGGENCCFGGYTVYSFDGTDPTVDDDADWGADSNLSNCFRGPALSDTPGISRNAFGFPDYWMTLVPTDGLQDSISITDPDATAHRDAVYATNYFNSAADHAGAGQALAMNYSIAGGFAYHAGPYVPGNVSVSAPVNISLGFPFFQIDCLDHNRELKSQIRVTVREWNTLAAFTTFASSGTLNSDVATDGDPYDTGVDEGLDDFLDWKSLEDLSDGNSIRYSYFGLTNSIDTNIVWNPSGFYRGFPVQ